MRRRGPGASVAGMARSEPLKLLDLTVSLYRALGPSVVLRREAQGASWTFDGLSAFVEMQSGGIAARFVDRPAIDAVSSSRAAAVYCVPELYALNAAGCERMVCDLLAFFCGTREPRFRFSGAEAFEAAG